MWELIMHLKLLQHLPGANELTVSQMMGTRRQDYLGDHQTRYGPGLVESTHTQLLNAQNYFFGNEMKHLLLMRSLHRSKKLKSEFNNIGSGNGLLPVAPSEVIIWTNADLLSMGPSGTNFLEWNESKLNFYSRKCWWKCYLQNGVHFDWFSMF